ncbi:hypothetical protein [Vibrio atypicus]|uniref:hypothetical protein n=1 Tax=Vibrio atypicus TaxID=558271 RepID=UPI003736E13F
MLLNELFALIIILLFVPLVWRDVTSVFWPKFIHERNFQHLTFAVIILFTLLWSAQAGVKAGLSIHFLALTTLTLMYGWRVAIVLSVIISFLLTTTTELSLFQLPEYILLSCLIPIATSYAVFLFSYHFLPRNIFVFIFVAGFLNGALTGTLHLLSSGAYLFFLDAYDWTTIVDNYLIFVPLLAFPEGLINGMALTMFCVFKPEWLRVFSDRDYIYNHYHKK